MSTRDYPLAPLVVVFMSLLGYATIATAAECAVELEHADPPRCVHDVEVSGPPCAYFRKVNCNDPSCPSRTFCPGYPTPWGQVQCAPGIQPTSFFAYVTYKNYCPESHECCNVPGVSWASAWLVIFGGRIAEKNSCEFAPGNDCGSGCEPFACDDVLCPGKAAVFSPTPTNPVAANANEYEWSYQHWEASYAPPCETNGSWQPADEGHPWSSQVIDDREGATPCLTFNSPGRYRARTHARVGNYECTDPEGAWCEVTVTDWRHEWSSNCEQDDATISVGDTVQLSLWMYPWWLDRGTTTLEASTYTGAVSIKHAGQAIQDPVVWTPPHCLGSAGGIGNIAPIADFEPVVFDITGLEPGEVTFTLSSNPAGEDNGLGLLVPLNRSLGCSCQTFKTTVIQADLDIDSDNNNGKDPPDESEQEDAVEMIPPGKILICNDDDDDHNGLLDLYDPNETSDLKLNDLIPVVIKVGGGQSNAQWRLWCISFGNGGAAIWSARTKVTVFPLATWQNDSHRVLYVEGTSVSSDLGDVVLTLEYDYNGDGVSDAYDQVCLTVVSMKLYYQFADDVQMHPLDDWSKPEGSDLLRSPKHIFGLQDDVFVVVTGPAGLGSGYFAAHVSSESDAGIDVLLFEDPPYSGNYYNSWYQVLRLADAHANGPPNKIKIVEEEVADFELKVSPNSSGSYNPTEFFRDVMLDKGEFAVCAVGVPTFQADVQPLLDSFTGTPLSWWDGSGGTHVFQPPGQLGQMGTFIQACGASTDGIGQADFLTWSCHGEYDGNLTQGSTLIIDAENGVSASQWNTDFDWAWGLSCSILHTYPGHVNNWGRGAWDDWLFGVPRPGHAVLGYHEDWGYAMAPIIRDFFQMASSGGQTIVSAYFNAHMAHSSSLPFAIVEHADNDADMLRHPTRDTHSNTMKYYAFDPNTQVWAPTVYTRTGDALPPAVDPSGPTMPSDQQPEVEAPTVQAASVVNAPQGLRALTRPHEGKAFYSILRHEAGRPQDSERAVAVARTALAGLFGDFQEEEVSRQIATLHTGTFVRGTVSEPRDDVPLARVVSYTHAYKGVPIVDDVLSVAVNDDRAINVHAIWHKVLPSERRDKRRVMRLADSMFAATDQASRVLGALPWEAPVPVRARLVYRVQNGEAGVSPRLTPAWEWQFQSLQDSHKRYIADVDAFTGQIIPSPEDPVLP